MAGIAFRDRAVSRVLIRHDVGIAVHVTLNVRLDRLDAVVDDQFSPDDSLSLDHDEDALFLRAFAALMDDALLLSGLAAEKLLVDLDNTADSGRLLVARIHHLADRMTKFPGCLLRYA